MKTAVSLLLVSFHLASALQSPYLQPVSAVNDTIASLTWRNNDVNTTGFLVFRGRTADSLSQIRSLTAAATTWRDSTTRCIPGVSIRYVYAIKATSATETSELSNRDSVTLRLPIVFRSPSITTLDWNYRSGMLSVAYVDSANCEERYKVHLSTDGHNFWHHLDIPQPLAKTMGPATISFDRVPPNTWLHVRVVGYIGNDSVVSAVKKIHSLDIPRWRASRRFIYPAETLSRFPISLGNWLSRKGDTILLHESSQSVGTSSVIDYSNPRQPTFKGYRSQNMTMLPPSTSLTLRDNFLVMLKSVMTGAYSVDGSHSIYHCRFFDSTCTTSDSLSLGVVAGWGTAEKYSTTALNDSLFVVHVILRSGGKWKNERVAIVGVNNSGFTSATRLIDLQGCLTSAEKFLPNGLVIIREPVCGASVGRLTVIQVGTPADSGTHLCRFENDTTYASTFALDSMVTIGENTLAGFPYGNYKHVMVNQAKKILLCATTSSITAIRYDSVPSAATSKPHASRGMPGTQPAMKVVRDTPAGFVTIMAARTGHEAVREIRLYSLSGKMIRRAAVQASGAAVLACPRGAFIAEAITWHSALRQRIVIP
ncbi:MAG: hypothetical protein MUF22_07815 [Chitinispirillaceae bacterium]|jgi:hypothetical protein|nr:hypothetical protein [Chitinispirillaceae bacterium]